MLKVLLTLIHVAVSLVLILTVLLQTGKRADLAGAFGGGGSQTAFGARGTATVLSKLTTVCAITFMVTSLSLVILAQRGPGSSTVLDEVDAPAPAQQEAPVVPGANDPLPAPVEGDDAAPSGSGSEDPLSVPAEGGVDESGTGSSN